MRAPFKPHGVLQIKLFLAAFCASDIVPVSSAVRFRRCETVATLCSDLAKNNILHHSVSSKKSPAEKLTLVRSVNMLETGIMVCNTTSGGGAEVLFVNAIWTQLTGIPEKTACLQGLWQLFDVPGKQLYTVLSARLCTCFQAVILCMTRRMMWECVFGMLWACTCIANDNK